MNDDRLQRPIYILQKYLRHKASILIQSINLFEEHGTPNCAIRSISIDRKQSPVLQFIFKEFVHYSLQNHVKN